MAFVTVWVGFGLKDLNGYRGRLRTTRVLWQLQGLAVDKVCGFYGHWGRLRTQRL